MARPKKTANDNSSPQKEETKDCLLSPELNERINNFTLIDKDFIHNKCKCSEKVIKEGSLNDFTLPQLIKILERVDNIVNYFKKVLQPAAMSNITGIPELSNDNKEFTIWKDIQGKLEIEINNRIKKIFSY